MDHEKILQDLTIDTDSKIILLVMDGLGGLPENGKTSLEAAHTPYLDDLAKKGECGLTEPIFMGITPGSGPSHMALFGYDPTRYFLGRGILEALGIDVKVGKGDLVARGNFATHENNTIVDRRAGRIPTEKNEELCSRLNQSFDEVDGVKVQFFPGKEHRFVIKLSAPGLSDELTDADPQKDEKPRMKAQPQNQAEEARKTAGIVNTIIDHINDILTDEPKANTALLRGFSKHPTIPSMQELFKLNPAAIANYPMYRGLAKIVGMDVLDVGTEMDDLLDALEEHYHKHNFFYVHVKKTDSYGEDGNYAEKKKGIEQTDAFIPRIQALNPDVLVVTGDHSTPCILKSHSWHPNPFLLVSPYVMPDKAEHFSERECSRGYLGRFPALYAVPLMLAHALKMKKFGA
jgi:2,3-bisphosphoglycerate-independent phosphoglycerate mutase